VNTLSFSSLPLKQTLLDNLDSIGYSAMTPIQSLSLPDILAGKDVIAKAKTGSGKTAAFGLGLLTKLDVEKFTLQSLVICPTRELAEQVAGEIRRLARQMNNVKVLSICGGVAVGPQINSLESGAHVIVATPGRLLDHLQKQRIDLSHLTMLVLDEADRMLDMGFENEMNQILPFVPQGCQTLLFSATYSSGILNISRRIQTDPQEITVDEQNSDIDQYFYEVNPHQRNQALANILSANRYHSAIIFCNTKAACQEVEEYLISLGFSAIALHGDLDQRSREQVLIQFANKSRAILVATDVAARGLDIKELDAVINYQITPDAEVHIHRIGRTGRAGEKGLAVTLVALNEMYRANAIEDYQKTPIVWRTLNDLTVNSANIAVPPMQTVCLAVGKKNKIRPGDILGALTKDAGLSGEKIGKINVTDLYSYVAIARDSTKQALDYLRQGKIKGKGVRARRL
jgi:ATP-independent RNA helicase DbpA